MKIPAVLAAYNEADRVGAVVTTVIASGLFSEVIVVDDGSSDGTPDVAQRAGARVIKLARNGGKGQAMKTGWQASGGGDVAFFDADLQGLTINHCQWLFQGYLAGYDQTCGLRDYAAFANPLQVFTPVITGERIVKKWVLGRVPFDCWQGFNIETAINYACDSGGGKTCAIFLSGLKNTVKESKRGLLKGLQDNYRMFTRLRQARKVLISRGGISCKS